MSSIKYCAHYPCNQATCIWDVRILLNKKIFLRLQKIIEVLNHWIEYSDLEKSSYNFSHMEGFSPRQVRRRYLIFCTWILFFLFFFVINGLSNCLTWGRIKVNFSGWNSSRTITIPITKIDFKGSRTTCVLQLLSTGFYGIIHQTRSEPKTKTLQFVRFYMIRVYYIF